ncbi:MAG: hypothetical protein HZB51_23780 [Chloroflexi bacterium]|nr:hypothetical protein [Chloroflexota bacterium]
MRLLFVNSAGLLTLAECKLWKNPEARREVVGQILDYAKEISQWSYEDLQRAVSKAQNVGKKSLHELVAGDTDDFNERDFIDSVSRNLRRGRFLLLIIGDGIRENVEQIANFLQECAHLNFGFALVEFGVFKFPSKAECEYFVQPRIIAQTVEIERAVFRIEDGQITSSSPISSAASSLPQRTKISEQIFFEKLNADAKTKVQLKTFFEKASSIGLYTEPGQNSMILKSSSFDINFGIFATNGQFSNFRIASTTEQIGQPQVGEEYLNQLAKLLNNGFVKRSERRTHWTVKIKTREGERYATVDEVVAVQDKWLEIIQSTLDKISKLDPE